VPRIHSAEALSKKRQLTNFGVDDLRPRRRDEKNKKGQEKTSCGIGKLAIHPNEPRRWIEI